MAMRLPIKRLGFQPTMEKIGGVSRYFSDGLKGSVLCEEERAAENVYIKKMEKEKLMNEKSGKVPQLSFGQKGLNCENVVPRRFYSKESAKPVLKGDEILKNIYLDVRKKFETAMGILRKEKITINPEDPAAVKQYAGVMKTIREKAGLFSESERIKYTIETQTQDIQDARTYLLKLAEIRTKRGLPDDLGIEPMMMSALDKVESEIKKPLMRNDKKGMALLTAEFDKINKKLGIKKEELPKYEEQLEMKIAKAQLEELKKETEDAMEAQAKGSELSTHHKVEAKDLDIRNFI